VCTFFNSESASSCAMCSAVLADTSMDALLAAQLEHKPVQQQPAAESVQKKAKKAVADFLIDTSW
jgi:alpha-D-ribose 1-methylphosphonate 5-triphosphate synthase subunit PhnG